jgi:DNA (cytosine-5)-methyltransferase 1
VTKALYTSVEICAGAGGQALGLEQAGFAHANLVELDEMACQTLRLNRPQWQVTQADVRAFDGTPWRGVDLLAGGVPCPPFSMAGKQLGADDERDLFPDALRLVRQMRPRAVMLENVRGLLDPKFAAYRAGIIEAFENMGYYAQWQVLHASHFGVPQLRPRSVLVALSDAAAPFFAWPQPHVKPAPTVGETLADLMAERGWQGVEGWQEQANGIAPTLVGGSKKHGGPDLGPTRARNAWAALGVDGKTLAEQAPEPGFDGMPKLTVRMAARIQGFPDHWRFCGRKTAAYRQVGNAFPPPVACAVGVQIAKALAAADAQLRKAA